jgi:quinoprotein glucose dehydrogenase
VENLQRAPDGIFARLHHCRALFRACSLCLGPWGGDRGGTRFSPLQQITPANVDRLVRGWEFHTGDLARRDSRLTARTKFEATPLFVESSLILCTPFNEVIALDPGSGAAKWRFDPKVSSTQRPANRYNCRGVASWVDKQASPRAACRSRIFMGTNDMRLIALDATSGVPCTDFGGSGEVKVDPGMPLEWPGEMQLTSPPVIARDVVIVGSAIADNVRVRAPHGTVRAFDARTGQTRWTWDPLLLDGIEAGAVNVWAPMSVDEARGFVFLPTSSPSPDFWGGKRPGNNQHSDSVVALRGETGELVWAFQTVHHDVWDYDLPAQPTLARIDTDAGARDVVVQPPKQGFLFVLDRATGQPIWPVEERAVPQIGAAGEHLSPTQPFPTHVPTLLPQHLSVDDAFGLISFWDRADCREQLARLRNDGLYTPPSTQGTLNFPMTGGGVNWGGLAFDPETQIVYVNTTRAAHIVTLIPAGETRGFKPPAGIDFGPQRGALCHDTCSCKVANRSAVQPTSVGCSRCSRSEGRPSPLAVNGRYAGRPRAALRAVPLGYAARQWRVGHWRGISVYRSTGWLPACIRCKDGHRTVAGQAASTWGGQPDDIHVERRAVRCNRRRWSFRGRNLHRRQCRCLSSGAHWRSPLDVVADH